jgi:uncharacterized RDD family membrane protein YckC
MVDATKLAEHSAVEQEMLDETRPNGARPEDSLQSLLRAYEETFTTLRTRNRVRWGRMRATGRFQASALRWGARYFLIYGVGHTLETLKRRNRARLSLHPGSAQDLDWLERVERYEAALPPIPAKRVLLVAVAVAALLGYAVASLLPSSVDADTAMSGIAGAVASFDFSKATETVDKDRISAVIAAGLLGFFLLAITYPFIASFRFKRLLFNLHPDAESKLDNAPVVELHSRSTGLYRLEGKAADAIGAEQPREFPFDLLLQAGMIVVLFPLWLVAAFSVDEVLGWDDVMADIGPIVLLALVLMWSPYRLWRLWRIWRQRTAGAPVLVTRGDRAHVTAASRQEGQIEPIGRIATRVDRLLAGVVDSFAVAGLAFIFCVAGLAIDDTWLVGLLYLLVFLPVAGAGYVLASHRKHTATPGKRWRKIHIARLDGRPVGLGVLLLREGVLKWLVFGGAAIFVWGLPLLANVGFGVASKDQRALHDRVVGTLVVDSLDIRTSKGGKL